MGLEQFRAKLLKPYRRSSLITSLELLHNTPAKAVPDTSNTTQILFTENIEMKQRKWEQCNKWCTFVSTLTQNFNIFGFSSSQLSLFLFETFSLMLVCSSEVLNQTYTGRLSSERQLWNVDIIHSHADGAAYQRYQFNLMNVGNNKWVNSSCSQPSGSVFIS